MFRTIILPYIDPFQILNPKVDKGCFVKQNSVVKQNIVRRT